MSNFIVACANFVKSFTEKSHHLSLHKDSLYDIAH
jgi:hypothetical protein